MPAAFLGPSALYRTDVARTADNLGGFKMIHYVWMFVVGIVVGLVARALMPGAQHMGILITGVLGVVGSFIGGLVTRLFHKPAEGSMFHPAGFIMSVIGAMILLFLWYKFGARL
jgi:uncharacterized membrane protein YeaQ/YmgE (transglycosylase-associated protein family)